MEILPVGLKLGFDPSRRETVLPILTDRTQSNTTYEFDTTVHHLKSEIDRLKSMICNERSKILHQDVQLDGLERAVQADVDGLETHMESFTDEATKSLGSMRAAIDSERKSGVKLLEQLRELEDELGKCSLGIHDIEGGITPVLLEVVRV